MKLNLKQQVVLFISLTLIPTLLLLSAGPLGLLEGLSISNSAMIMLALIFLSTYYYISYQTLKTKEQYSIILSVLFYVNFLLLMIVVLISFNLIVVAGFLYTNQVPMGMDLEPSQATGLLLLGLYLIIISSLGMYYLSFSKKSIINQASR